MSIGMLFIPESPRWLLLQDKEEKARKALTWLRPYPETVEPEITEIKAAIDTEKSMAGGTEIADLWRNPIDRRRTLLAVGAVSLQAASGAMYMIGKEFCVRPYMITPYLMSFSLWHLLFRDGSHRQRFHELLHPRRRWRRRHPYQQLCRLAMGSA